MRLLSICILSMFMFAISCSKDDSNDLPENNEDYFLMTKIDGESFSIDDDVIVSILPNQTPFFTISAIGDATFVLTLDSPTTEGTFIPAAGRITALSYQESSPFASWGTSEEVGSGTITISENTATYMKGTFSFTGINLVDNTTKVFTEGSFKAKKL